MSTIVALRTNAFGPAERRGLEGLANVGHELVVVADERVGPIDTGPYGKASLTDAAIWRLGLRWRPRHGLALR